MKWPIVVRSRTYQDWLDDCAEGEKEYHEQRIKDLEKIIAQNCIVQEMQLRHIKTLGGIQDELGLVRAAWQAALAHVDTVRKEYAGDLQLAHTRYDEFVRDMLERLMTRAAPPARAQSSSQQPVLPDAIQSAIEEFSFGNPIIEEQLTAEAWRRIKRDEKPEEIAEKIRRGETPE